MADNKLNLLVKFTGVDKLSGGLRNIMGASKASTDKLKTLRSEVKGMEKDLSRAQKLIASGTANGGLIYAERELRAAIAETNQEIGIHKRKLEGITAMQGKFRKIGSAATSAGNAMTLGLTLPLVAFGATAISASRDAAGAVAQVEASLASMGPVAGRNLMQLKDQANALMQSSLFDDDEILKKVTSVMLTFGKVTGKTFDRAQLAAVNLSTKLGGDLQGSTLMLGKALNDPVKGITALSRAGISFTGSQKELIKSMVAGGNAAGAQNMILAELEKQVGGAAAAARKADPGGALAISFGEFQQTVGDKLLPKLTPLVEKATVLLDKFSALPGPVQDAALGFGAFAIVAGPLVSGIGGLAMAAAVLLPIIIANAGAAAMLVGVWLPIIAVIALIAYGVYQIYKNWDGISAWFGAKWDAVKAGFVAGWDGIKAAFNSGIETVKGIFGALPAWLASVGQMALTGLLGPFGMIVGLIQSNWTAISGAFTAGVAMVRSIFSALPAQLSAIGRMMMDGLLLAINPLALGAKLIAMAKNGMTAFKNYLGIKSPSRLMMEMGGHISAGLGMGIDRGRGGPVRAMGRMAGAVAGAGALSLSPASARTPAAASAAAPQVSKVEIHIHQQPGEDANALAERVARLVEQAQRSKGLRSMQDEY